MSPSAGTPAARQGTIRQGRAAGPLSEAISDTGTMSWFLLMTRSPATPGSDPEAVGLDHLGDGGATFGQVLEQGQAHGCFGSAEVVEPRLLPTGGLGTGLGSGLGDGIGAGGHRD